MLTLIQVKTNGDIIEKNVKEIAPQTLYKHCQFKSSKDFEHIHTFQKCCEGESHGYMVYGKKSGRANTENKYDFPPPIDTLLLFGTICIVKQIDNEYVSLTTQDWEKMYEELFGGFEDLDGSEEERSMDSEIYSDDDYTKEGYLKDNFVVDDDELEEEEFVPEEEEQEVSE
tara:strand:+ start:299 stop:811 length:513 start_codon:yes stop_codon:yes gene_type:complete